MGTAEAATSPGPKKVRCPWGCGLTTTPGPCSTHAKVCKLNPYRGYSVDQPTGECRYGCGLSTTRGALTTHETYGCENRPADEDGPAVRECKFGCGLSTMAGAMVGHERACPQRPETADLIERARFERLERETT